MEYLTLIKNNGLWRPIAFFVIVLLSLATGRMGRYWLERLANSKSNKRITKLGSILLKSISRPIVLVALLIGLWVALELDLLTVGESHGLKEIFSKILRVLNAITVGYLVYSLVDVVNHYLTAAASKTESRVDDVLAPLVGKSIRVTVSVLVILNILSVVMKEDITTILASLGVGGLAIALAGQDTFKNFFGSLVILSDKPFEMGDRIEVEGYDGIVEDVGFRSTKMRTLDGHMVTVPNSGMVNKTVRNIGKRPYIKRVANITITYDTKPDKVDEAVAIIKEILHNHEGMDENMPPRVYFNEFNDWALNIVMIYWYTPPEYWEYMKFTEKVNRLILKKYNDAGIEFAFPSQTIYMDGANGESN